MVELVDNIAPNSKISFAGWDRIYNTPENVTLIHHPRGDVKKITYDDNPQIENDEIEYDGQFTIPAKYSYSAIFNEVGENDFGIFEKGSSGCGWFNQEGRVIGTMIGGFLPFNCNNRELFGAGGRFNLSWEGNGTNATRLKNWLGASSNPITMDCMQHPVIKGSEIICDKNYGLYLLEENMSCNKGVSWHVAPSNLFEAGMPTSGTGHLLALKGRNGASGSATLTYTLTSNNCNDVILSHQIWVGNPANPTYFLQAWYDPFTNRITLSIPEIPGRLCITGQ